ncbi:MAG: Re/Si-specific NAD(P)(+) transhydrogenase subunit alpha [Myxococcota bacterium]|nr:Re/Si-specific NAD(P)(+) transhydrogenase subunit alpha [Myxococcota bacterium]MEC8381717.1 Re/Si-specific NAD(P)(+) transhydrogenase subunit alpha [Myxococcota bacterium]
MKLGIPKATNPLERRVATTPSVIKKLHKLGFTVFVEQGAGVRSNISDQAYIDIGAHIVESPQALWDEAEIILSVRPPETRPDGTNELDLFTDKHTLVTMVRPATNEELVTQLKAKDITLIALDCVPRITRAQKMDVLSSMANIAGYRAVVEAANSYGGFFSGQMTAAGKSPPAKVLVIGAGVAGLAAIGAARGLGAVVRAFDVRAAAGEQVMSMGAEFLQVDIDESGDGGGGYAKTMSKEFIDAEMALFREQAKEVDVVITTALIPGKPAPKLWLKDMLEIMKDGSVVVDLAAEMGGNCEGCVANEVVQVSGVHIIGYTDLASRMSTVASEFFATNLFHLLDEFGGAEGWEVDLDNEVIRGCTVLNKGEMLWPPPRKAPPPKPPVEATPAPEPEVKAAEKQEGGYQLWLGLVLAVIFAVIGMNAPSDFVEQFSIFVLSCFIGWQVIWNVSHSLHTPLMAVTNAISGIIIVGGMLQLGGFDDGHTVAAVLGALAILFASINIAGGFLVTQRMLKMFRKG